MYARLVEYQELGYPYESIEGRSIRHRDLTWVWPSLA
jgi:hypothetical protein